MKHVLWTGLMVVLAILAIGAQIDRSARRMPELAAIVPAPFSSFAVEQLARSTVRSASPGDALQTARLLVQRRPVPSESLSLLAIAEERSGNSAASGRLVQDAARRGWRDSIAQQAMFDIALMAGDHAEASRRLAALLALDDDEAQIADLTGRLLGTPEGRAAMAGTLKSGGRWTRTFMATGPRLMPREAALTIARAAALGARLDCKALVGLEQGYQAGRKADEAAIIADSVKDCTTS